MTIEKGALTRRNLSALLTALLAIVLFSASPAQASDTVKWKPVSTNSNWSCGAYIGHNDRSHIKLKACIVTNSSGGAQAVLVVQNAGTSDQYLSKGRVIFESQLGGDVWCAPTNLAEGRTAGCYAPTVQVGNCWRTSSATVELTLTRVTAATADGQYVPCG
ncbi:hypothetical protein [Streptomyces sp. CB09001]|uniref:hypothetical protein n=1 Tax=Streptomyces sp. CB09001 TaxID=2083284 RepID=UPI0013BE8D7A|nr:hypothetical protein [Streptomyces sp. CB09001]